MRPTRGRILQPLLPERGPVDLEALLKAVREQARGATRLLQRLELPPGCRALNVHSYALPAYEAFLRRFYSDGKPRILALSMNPGPFGAVQTGIPFCDVPMARTFLPGFDALSKPPAWARAERREMSAQKLIEWSGPLFGGIEGLYRRILLAMTCPIGILKGPRRTNVPLPALNRASQREIEAFIARHAPHEVRAAHPTGILLLGDWARHTWDVIRQAAPDLRGLPARAVPHPAAHITNRAKFDAWTRGYKSLLGPLEGVD